MLAGLLNGLLVTEPIEEPASGVYIAAADTPAYGWLEGLALSKHGVFLGTKYASGKKYIAVALETPFRASNVAGQIRVGPEYFTKALREYSDWKIKWWREAIQNAVDAGATKIECVVNETDEGYLVSCADDGTGMTEDVLINKFLVFGGTTKATGAGTRGGFGVAKELLILPWIRWRIHSRDGDVSGEGIEYEWKSAPYREGTLLEVLMPADNATPASAVLAFIENCELPKVRFVVERRIRGVVQDRWEPKAKLKCGTPLRDFDGKAMLCHNKRASGSYEGEMLVRTMGLYMFGLYVPRGIPGAVIVELTGPSIDLLTSNRDGFRDRELRRDVENFGNELAADVKSALRKKHGLVREKFLGPEGRYRVEREASDREARMLDLLEVVAPQGKASGRHLALDKEQIGAVLEAIGAGEKPETTGIHKDSFSVTYDLAAVMLDGTRMDGATNVEAALRQLSWSMDFYLINEVEGFRVPKKFRPETMTANVRRLARTWGELCRFVLIQLGSRSTFGIGFVFEDDVGAQHLEEDGQNWLLLNPFLQGRVSKSGAILNPADTDQLMWLYASAIHEATHMADGLRYHDESFAAAMTRNVARTSGKDKQVRAIRRVVAAAEAEQRSRRAEPKPAAPAAPRSVGLSPDREAKRRKETSYYYDKGYNYVAFVAPTEPPPADATLADYMRWDTAWAWYPTRDLAYERVQEDANARNAIFELREGGYVGESGVVRIFEPE